MPDPKKECNPFEKCKDRRLLKIEINKKRRQRENVASDPIVKQPKYEEKVGYQAKTAKWDESMAEEAEESGTGQKEHERNERLKKYKTRY